jgi:hypothetical protein
VSLGGLISRHLDRMQNQLVDSDLETTRMFWRLKSGATEAQAKDPRPFNLVLANMGEG